MTGHVYLNIIKPRLRTAVKTIMKIPKEEYILSAASRLNFSEKHIKIINDKTDPETNWRLILDLSSSRQVSPLVAKNILSIDNTLIPKDFIEQFCSDIRSGYALNDILLWNEFVRIFEIAEDLKIKMVAIKGVVFNHLLYGNSSLRRTSDIDVLINKNDLFTMADGIKSLGYSDSPDNNRGVLSREYYLRRDHHLVLEKEAFPNMFVSVNLHWDILNPFASIKNMVDDFLENAVIRTMDGKNILTLSDEDMLFESIIELYKDIPEERCFIPKRLIDISAIIDIYGNGIDWCHFAGRAKRYRINNLAYYCLISVKDLVKYPDGLNDPIYKLRPGPAKKRLIDKAIKRKIFSNMAGFYPIMDTIYWLWFFEIVIFNNRVKTFFTRVAKGIFKDMYDYNGDVRITYCIMQAFKTPFLVLRRVLLKKGLFQK